MDEASSLPRGSVLQTLSFGLRITVMWDRLDVQSVGAENRRQALRVIAV